MPRLRVTYANVVGTLALFIALGGSSYAALTVTGADVRNNSLTGGDIRDRSLSARDFGGRLPAGAAGARGLQGPAGPAGATGPQGPKGDNGTNGANGFIAVTGLVTTNPMGDDTSITGTYEPTANTTLGSFTKQRADTRIRVRYPGTFEVAGDDAADHCQWQLRVEPTGGSAATPNAPTGSGQFHLYRSSAGGNSAGGTLEGMWSGLGTGDHTVSLWYRGVTPTVCTANPGAFQQVIWVEETPAA